MKNKYIILSIIATFALGACQKVIDLDLKKTQPLIVIEANVTDQFKSQVVKVSQTKPFTEDNSISPVLGATITLKDLTENRSYRFSSLNNDGTYFSEKFRGKPGNTYQISVEAENQVYTAKSAMPQKVVLDSLSITEISFFGEKQKYLQVNYADPEAFANQYKFVLTVNETVVNQYFVDFDRFNNGKNITNILFNDKPKLKATDIVKVEFQCIDMNVYRYFFAISQINGNGGPPTSPSNPDSNFDNGALGYFSAHTVDERTATIP